MPPTDEQITNELRALRPAPSDEFAAELDAWAAAGFPPRRRGEESADRTPSLLARVVPRRRLLAVAAGVTAVTLGVAVATEVIRQEPDQDLGGPAINEETGTESVPRQSGAPGGDAAVESAPTTVPPVPGPPADELKPGKERVQERSAAMTLSTEPDKVDEVADEVVEVTERYEGIVVSSNVSSGAERGRATFDLRIPTASLQAALADLSDLASVSSRNEGTLDITAPFVTAEERFRDTKTEVDALVEELGEADSESEITSIRERLARARRELAAARAELGALKQRADFSRVSLTVVGDGDGDGDADGWSLGDAADDAVSVLEDLAGASLVTLAVLLPLAAVGAAAWFGLSALRRRQRERALDE